ncbi:agmatine deiminase family protein [Pontibacter russatus]|uniref:agmatine deiminase family protein n=1 Tax=Pontibacter russatus TaxID=2694929 RepID=UPI001379DA5E|nr:agmatine deiminase family protein [Pontibacter russatus]
MIRDNQTNFVYIADTLQNKYPNFSKEFVSKLNENAIGHGILPNTKDVWAVDYMPIQVSEKKFVRFSYKPDYLIQYKKWARTISDVDAICEKIGIRTIKSDIVIDGGNISRWDDKILMTTKVFIENKKMPELQLIQELKELLEINEIYFVPVEKGDWLGHIDGMARFIDSQTVLVNNYQNEEKSGYINFLTALYNSKFQWKAFPFNPYKNTEPDDATGVYLNYLEMEKILFLPIFGLLTDDEAVRRAKETFPGKKIVPVKSNEPARDNGIINCLTWNIRR